MLFPVIPEVVLCCVFYICHIYLNNKISNNIAWHWGIIASIIENKTSAIIPFRVLFNFLYIHPFFPKQIHLISWLFLSTFWWFTRGDRLKKWFPDCPLPWAVDSTNPLPPSHLHSGVQWYLSLEAETNLLPCPSFPHLVIQLLRLNAQCLATILFFFFKLECNCFIMC